MQSGLHKRTSYLNKSIDYLFDANIVEYDMKNAGLNLIKYFKLLDDKTINELDKMEKVACHKKVGLMQRDDKDFSKRLLDSFAEARRMFFVNNQIDDSDVLTIKKDAIFTINKNCKITSFGNIVFDKKNVYTSYIHLNKLEFYFNSRTDDITIKGLGQKETLTNILNKHRDYLLKFIFQVVRMSERRVDRRLVVKYITDFIRMYRQKKLPIEYYRTLTSELMFMVQDDIVGGIIDIDETNDISNVIIDYNYMKYIMPIASLFI